MNKTLKIDSVEIADCVLRFRDARPHVHCITNSVAQRFTANVLLAAGATPSMTIAEEEVGDFVQMADALLINLGTMDTQRSNAVDRAITAANEDHTPWALDPVFVQASPIRLDLAIRLLSRKPTLMRCNAPELAALSGADVANKTLGEISNQIGTTIALTGAIDCVSSTNGAAEIRNGSPTMDRITAMGCALTALIAGFLGVEEAPHTAAISALVLFGLAGELAESKARGPGSFVPHFLDALANVNKDEIEKGAKVQ